MSNPLFDSHPDWQRRIHLLRESAWEDAGVNAAKVEDWLRNFQGKVLAAGVEQKHALHLLQQFIYFGKAEITECLRVLYRDHFVYPAVQELKKTLSDPFKIAQAVTQRAEQETAFIGVGLPSESGQHMLYPFRQANDLSAAGVVSLLELFHRDQNQKLALNNPSINHLIFIDDFCASGEQVIVRLKNDIALIRTDLPSLKISFFVLFATVDGLAAARGAGMFDAMEAAITFDEDYKVFSANSLSYQDGHASISLAEGQLIAEGYGKQLYPLHPLGHRGGQMLLGFQHNTPDNTLPIFWFKDAPPWYAIFPRTIKK